MKFRHGRSTLNGLEDSRKATNQSISLRQPGYSPDLVPTNFYSIPKLKPLLKGQRFDTIEEIQQKKNVGRTTEEAALEEMCDLIRPYTFKIIGSLE